MIEHAGDLTNISEWLVAGVPAPAGWKPVTACDCLVLVGLTGVGKSTVLARLTETLPGIALLPDRRELTDRLMIPFIQRQDGLPIEPVRDRALRFDYTRRYRQRFPGGMAHALSQLSVGPDKADAMIIFDGLRGENEVRHAAALMPQARFLLLEAPDAVRIRRLVARRDTFDAISASISATPSTDDPVALAALGVPGLAEILSDEEQRQVLRWVQDGEVAVSELAGKVRIVLEERRNYDPPTTRSALLEYAAERTLVADTSILSAEEIVERTVFWVDA